MAFGALALLRAGLELALVRVRLMAIVAIGKGQRLLEVSVQMAFGATDGRMLAQQRIFRFRVVEFELRQNLLPARGRVAVFANLWLERTFVRIHVAIEACLELHVLISRRAAQDIRLVALFARDLNVLAGEGIAGLRMVKLLCGLPVGKIVALQAIVAELPFVHIFMARHAILREPEKRLGKILVLNKRALFADHVHRRMTFLAGNSRVLAFQLVAGLLVIKLFLGRFPVNQVEIFAVVFEVAANAILSVWIAHLNLVVIPVLGREASRDFLMAIQAFEGGNIRAE